MGFGNEDIDVENATKEREFDDVRRPEPDHVMRCKSRVKW